MSETELIDYVAIRLRSFTTRQFLRSVAAQYFEIPISLSDGDALRVLRLAIEKVEEDIG